MYFFHHKDLGNHLLQLCPKVVKHPVYHMSCVFYYLPTYLRPNTVQTTRLPSCQRTVLELKSFT